MINVPAQKQYWQRGAASDLETAEILIDRDKLLEGLFFCHLAIEKAVKARVVEVTNDVPPRTHNLLRLAKLAQLSLPPDRAELMGEMMQFHLEGRYPDDRGGPPEKARCRQYLADAEKVVKWLVEPL